jgi:hypothetical protein
METYYIISLYECLHSPLTPKSLNSGVRIDLSLYPPSVAIHRFGKHLTATTDLHATTEQLTDAVFSM